MTGPKDPFTPRRSRPGQTTARLRLLATTDLHMQLTGFDYVADRPLPGNGLAGIATLIDTARAEAAAEGRACLLLDNGDLLQGNAMGSYLAGRPVTADHPVVACVNRLGYGAVGVGNHDLDFGFGYLDAVAERLDAPMLTSNLSAPTRGLRRTALLHCPLPDGLGSVAVGVLSVLPRDSARWNRHVVGAAAQVETSAQRLRRAIPALRAAGAQVVVVLAHMGIAPDGSDPEDSAVELARVPGIDALIAGHTHQRFPGRDHARQAGVFPGKGQVLEVPAVMPGHAGSDLGVLDLTLNRKPGRDWQVIGHVSSLRRNTAEVPAHPAIVAAVAPVHDALRRHLSVPLGRTDRVLHNYFSLAAPTATGLLTAQAEGLSVQAALSGRPEADLPLLVAASAHSAGGRDGPDHFLTIPEGPVLRRHFAGLTPFSNEVWALRLSGAALRRRLEISLSVYASPSRTGPARPLMRPEAAAFNHETIFGITYSVDLTAPPGRRLGPITWRGAPLDPDRDVILVTNQFRAAGGGGFDPAPAGAVVLRQPCINEDSLAEALAGAERLRWPAAPAWHFVPAPCARAEVRTSPLAAAHLGDIAHLHPRATGTDDAGFLRVELDLGGLQQTDAPTI